MTLADHPNSRFSASNNPPLPLPAAQKRSWIDVLLHRPEPEPPPAPVPPRAQPTRRLPHPLLAPQVSIDSPFNGIDKADLDDPRNSVTLSRLPPKPLPDVTDLLVMSTLEKEPLAAPGASDLLDSLVQDHLQRAAAPRETPEQAAAALGANLLGAPAERPALAEAPGANDGAGRLQQEIASLLAGDPHADAPKEPAPLADAAQHTLTVDPFADFPTAAPPIEQVPTKPGMNVPTANVSSAELEMLLASPDHDPASDDLTAPVEEPSAAEAVRAELAADAGGPTQIQQPITASSDATDEVAAKLSEADGVMAQELAQLMNEKPSAANASAPAAANPMPPELAAAVQNIMNNPVQTAERAADAPAAPTEITPTPDAPTPETPIAQTGANVVAALDTLAETTPHPHAAAPNILARTWRLFTGIFVMMLQIIDMPFGWIKEPDKNVLGMAALLLLLGGALLKALSWWMEHH